MREMKMLRKDSGQAGMTKIKHMCFIGKNEARMILYRKIASGDTTSQ
jgi:hypothetical protein